MIAFYEKAERDILSECRQFIKKNSETKNDYHVFREALKLSSQLIDSLLASQKQFEDAIKNEIAEFGKCENAVEKECYIARLNKKEIVLVLDTEAHRVLDELEEIKRKCHS